RPLRPPPGRSGPRQAPEPPRRQRADGPFCSPPWHLDQASQGRPAGAGDRRRACAGRQDGGGADRPGAGRGGGDRSHGWHRRGLLRAAGGDDV
ncbi:MAG: hypothetical protein AVDCRST_MAG19-4464, partial [uncultured Thermomicrobiales bacterium]